MTLARLLVIDDEVLMGRALARALRSEAQVVTACGGAEAIEILQDDQDFDLILCDMMMPGMSGADVHAWIGGNLPDLQERIVFITGDVTTDETRHFLASTRNRCLLKPVALDVLRALATKAGRACAAPHALVPSVSPARTAPSERRVAPRMGATGVTGLFTFQDRLVPVTIIDWSASGLRARPSATSPMCDLGDMADVLLQRRGDRRPIRAGVMVRRWHTAGDTRDLCVQFSEMDADTRTTFSGWLEAGSA